MKLDLRWFFVPAGPFVLLAFVRLFMWVWGFEWDASSDGIEGIATVCFMVGLGFGAILLLFTHEHPAKRWTIRIGGGDNK